MNICLLSVSRPGNRNPLFLDTCLVTKYANLWSCYCCGVEVMIRRQLSVINEYVYHFMNIITWSTVLLCNDLTTAA